MSGFNGHLGLHALAKKRQWRCAYCRQVTHCKVCNPHLDKRLAATRDHQMPKSKGGPNGARNLVIACFGCNQDKGDRVLVEDIDFPSLAVSRRAPRRRAVAGQPSWRACRPDWHKTQQQADNAARALLASSGRSFESYRCEFCQKWHLERAGVPKR